jgi:hypothetical protein
MNTLAKYSAERITVVKRFIWYVPKTEIIFPPFLFLFLSFEGLIRIEIECKNNGTFYVK